MSNQNSTQPDNQANMVRRALLAVKDMQRQLDENLARQKEPIAVIGLGCRFPGQANQPEAYWQLLREGRDGVIEVPVERWNSADFYDENPDAVGKTNTKQGGFLEQIDRFDPGFFGISPREARSMDPQHRLALEVAWEALEHAGIAPDSLLGSRTGVYLGITANDYLSLAAQDLARVDPYTTSGNVANFVAGRIAYILGLHGPCMAVDAACASSLVTVHLACQALRLQECDLALAGGVNLMVSPAGSVLLARAKILSPDGRCKTFDASADGMGRGEGCGIFVLKRLSDALADHDPIMALIRGSAVNQDGRSSGLTAPNPVAQSGVIRAALAAAGLTPADIGYVEAHGTGTALGDPIEIEGLRRVFAAAFTPEQRLKLGSVKSNFGHLESAAGAAGLMKLVLALYHRYLPPSLHFKNPNPHIDWASLPFEVVTAGQAWPAADKPRRAGVSAFGLSGTIAHVVLEEYTPPARPAVSDCRPLHLLCLSAQNEDALRALAQRHCEYIAQHPEIPLADIASTLNRGRNHWAWRAPILAATPAEAIDQLVTLAGPAEKNSPRSIAPQPNEAPLITFLFTGQGAQYVNMGRQLFESSKTFRELLQRCEEILRPELEYPLLAVMFGENSPAGLLHETAYTQPALFALEYSLAKLWQEWGISPDILIGHSIGEYVAACLAGVFSLEAGLKLVASRGRLMQALPRQGLMAAVFAPEEAIMTRLPAYAGQVSLAALNGPEQVVISGQSQAVSELLQELERAGFSGTRLQTSHAFHSALLDPMLPAFQAVAEQVSYQPPQIRVISNLTGKLASGQDLVSADYWCRHTRGTVRFANGLTSLDQLGSNIFLEVGPQPVLLGMAKRIPCPDQAARLLLPSLSPSKPNWETVLSSGAALYQRGIDLNWANFDRDYQPRRVHLPTYPFQRQRYWLEDGSISSQPSRLMLAPRGAADQPLSGQRLLSPRLSETVFELPLSRRHLPLLNDHCLAGRPIFPATAYIELLLQHLPQLDLAPTGQGVTLDHLSFLQPLIFDEEGQTIQLQLLVQRTVAGQRAFEIVSRSEPTTTAAASPEPEASWHCHCQGQITLGSAEPAALAPSTDREDILAWQRQLTQQRSVADYYAMMQSRSLEYGPTFQNIRAIWHDDQTILGLVSLSETNLTAGGPWQMHPGLLDSCWQLSGILFEALLTDPTVTLLPVALTKLEFFAALPAEVYCLASRSTVDSSADLVSVDFRIVSLTGQLLAKISGLGLKKINQATLARSAPGEDALFQLEWQNITLPEPAAALRPDRDQPWLIIGDGELAAGLAHTLQKRGQPVWRAGLQPIDAIEPNFTLSSAMTPEMWQAIWQQIRPSPGAFGIIYLLADTPPAWPAGDDLASPLSQECADLLSLVQALIAAELTGSARLILVTRGAEPDSSGDQLVDTRAFRHSLWGFLRSAALEYPDLCCLRLDLEAEPVPVMLAHILELLDSPTQETELLLRGGVFQAARLVPGLDRPGGLSLPDGPYRLEIPQRGVIENLTILPLTPRPVGPGEVEIAVHYTGMNFRDVLNVLGMYPGDPGPLGYECAGIIRAVGPDVTEFQPGDAVVAISGGCYASSVVTLASLVVKKPAQLTLAEAATLPVTLITAYYALCQLAQVRRGERILIHAAAGGVGIAAIGIAQHLGLTIFATAGNPRKRAFLQALGVPHIMDSRKLDFSAEIAQITGGAGVDVILNSLSGEFIERSLAVLGTGGRFLEIGKIGIWDQDKMAKHRPDVSYFPIAIDEMILKNPSEVGQILRSAFAAFKDYGLAPLPLRRFPIRSVRSAFRYMMHARHIGKIVIGLEAPTEAAGPGYPPAGWQPGPGTYLITGGLGAIGLHLAEWLVVQKGVTSLILTGRSEPRPEAREIIARLQARGARVDVLLADIADHQAVRALLAQMASEYSPLRGIFHAAGVLDDAAIPQQQPERFRKVFAAKVQGAWNLHQLTLGQPLDAFVLFSSASALLGSPGQANYASANAFLDALARFRRAQGLSGLSVQWGPWQAGGMASQVDQREQRRWQALGLGMISPETALATLDRLMMHDCTEIALIPIDRKILAKQAGMALLPLRLAELIPADSRVSERVVDPSETLQARLDQVAPHLRRRELVSFLREQAARILGFDPAQLTDLNKPLNELGLDSLMAVELRNALSLQLGQSLSPGILFRHPTVRSLAGYLADEVLHLPSDQIEPLSPPAGVRAAEVNLLDEIEHLSDAELDAEFLALAAQHLNDKGNADDE